MNDFCEQVTIDGPAAAGKSTIAKRVASCLGGYHVNSGDLYRTITWLALRNKIDPKGESACVLDLVIKNKFTFQRGKKLDDHELVLSLNGKLIRNSVIRSPEVTEKVSLIAKISPVRTRVIKILRKVKSFGIIVMDGRDIGTIIFPNAKYKFFLTASPLERARRRLKQSEESLNQATLESVAKEISKRDESDMNRIVAPLKPAPDAHIINSTNLGIEQVVDVIVAHVRNP